MSAAVRRRVVELVCRNLHPLEWREDGCGRTQPCADCRSLVRLVVNCLAKATKP